MRPMIRLIPAARLRVTCTAADADRGRFTEPTIDDSPDGLRSEAGYVAWTRLVLGTVADEPYFSPAGKLVASSDFLSYALGDA